jgi:SRSO17 transposase
LVEQVAEKIGEEDAVIVFDPSGFPKKGNSSVGVQRQWCGRVGKTENCQVATCMGYVSRVNHTLIDTRLYLPKSWTKDRARCRKAGVPKDVRFQTRHEHALEMLDEHGKKLPHAWVAGDDEMGRSALFRRGLNDRGEQYFLSVPSNTTIRDLQKDEEVVLGTTAARKRPFQQVQDWKNKLSKSSWHRVEVRDAEKGPLIVEVVACRVQTKISRCHMKYEEQLVIVRTRESNGKYKYDYYFSNAKPSTKSEEYGRVACAAHRIEECIKRGKSEAGLADYEVRNWLGWHHHQALSILAVWFLVTETERGKKMDTCDHASANSGRIGHVDLHEVRLQNGGTNIKEQNPPFSPQRNRQILSLQNP